jgi:hypothetical protein
MTEILPPIRICVTNAPPNRDTPTHQQNVGRAFQPATPTETAPPIPAGGLACCRHADRTAPLSRPFRAPVVCFGQPGASVVQTPSAPGYHPGPPWGRTHPEIVLRLPRKRPVHLSSSPDPRVPNGDRDDSLGLSHAMPQVKRLTPSRRPEGAREPPGPPPAPRQRPVHLSFSAHPQKACPFVVLRPRKRPVHLSSPPNPCVPNGDRYDSLGLSPAMPQVSD